jgi:single-strand DNA-binding protein
MSKDLNKVQLIGRLGQDPEVRATANGTTVVNATLATGDKWKDKNGQVQEHTEWSRLVVWDKLGDIMAQYCKKGSKIYVEGALRTRKWQHSDGSDRYSTEIRVSEIIMLDSPDDRPARGHTAPADSTYAGDPPAKAQDDGFDDIPF